MIYKVTVHCYGEKPAAFVKGKKLGDRPNAVTCKVAVLVEAQDSEAACVDAMAHAEAQAPTDVRWKEFDMLSCAPVSLPILVIKL